MGDSNEISASQRPPAVPPRSPSRPLDNSFWSGNGVVVVGQRTSASANESRWAARTGRRVSQVVRRTYDILRTNRRARRLVDTGRPPAFVRAAPRRRRALKANTSLPHPTHLCFLIAGLPPYTRGSPDQIPARRTRPAKNRSSLHTHRRVVFQLVDHTGASVSHTPFTARAMLARY